MFRILLALALLPVVSCAAPMPPPQPAAPPPPPAPAFRDIHGGLLLTTGVVITAEDGSFSIAANQQFTSPFHQGNSCVVAPVAEDPGQGERSGARRVRVTIPGRGEIHGLLSLCGAPANATGATASRYTLEVPQSYVDATSGGRVSVVFESHRDANGGDLQEKSWILWLSAHPFPPPR